MAPSSSAGPDDTLQPIGSLVAAARRGSWTIFAAQIASQLISLAVLGVLYRWVAPEAFGLLGMALTWITLVRLLAAFGLGTAVVQRPQLSPTELGAVFWTQLGCGVLAAGLGAALAPLVARFYGTPELAPVAAALAGTLLLAALGLTHQALLERHLRWQQLAIARTAAQALAGITGIAVAWRGGGVWSLVVQQYVEWGCLSLFCWLAESWRPGRPRWEATAGELVRFGGHYTASGLMFYLATNADKVLLGLLGPAGERALGFYSQAFNLTMRPVLLVTTPVTGVMLPVLSRAAHDAAEYRRLLIGFFQLVGWLLLPAGVGLWLIAPDLMLVLGGDAWQPAGSILRALAPLVLVQGFVNIAGSVLASTGRTDRLFWASVVLAVVLCQAFVMGRLLGGEFGPAEWGPALGVAVGYSLAMLLVLSVPYLLYCLHAVGVRLSDVLSALRMPLLATLVMGSVVALVNRSLQGDAHAPLTRLAANVAVGVVVYGLLGRRELAIQWRQRSG